MVEGGLQIHFCLHGQTHIYIFSSGVETDQKEERLFSRSKLKAVTGMRKDFHQQNSWEPKVVKKVTDGLFSRVAR